MPATHTIQCTCTTIKSSNMRLPATSRPLNGHFAITLFPFITLAISTGIISKSLTFNINIVHIIHHPGVFLGPPPGHTAWRWGTRVWSPVDGLEPSAQGRLFLYRSLSHVLLASCYGGVVVDYRISSIRRLGVNQQIVCCVPGVKTSRGVILKEASALN